MNNVFWGYGGKTYQNLDEAMKEIIKEYNQTVFEEVQKALTETAQEMAKVLEDASPIGNSNYGTPFKQNWAVESKFKNAKFVYNKKLAKNRIPVSNLIEYTSYNTPFIQQTMNRYKEDMLKLFVSKMEQKLK